MLLPTDLDLVTLTFIVLEGKEVVIINICIKFGPIFTQPFNVCKKPRNYQNKTKDTNTNRINSPFQILVMRRTYKST